MPDTAEPPLIPRHSLRLINWSRTSRSALGVLWYLALPFTLVNLMGFMSPPGSRIARVALRATLVIVGITLTITAQVWLIAIGETLLRKVQFASTTDMVGEGNVIAVTLLLLTSVVVRSVRGAGILRREKQLPGSPAPHPRWLVGTSLLNAAVIIAVGATFLVAPATRWIAWLPVLAVPTPANPAEVRKIESAFPDERSQSDAFCLALKDGDFAFEQRIDPLNAVALAGGIVMVVVWSTLIIVGLARNRRGALGPLSGAGLAATFAIVLLNAVGATLRLGVDWVMTYLDRLGSLGWINGSRPMSLYERHVMAYQGIRTSECRQDVGFVYSGSYYVDSLPLIGVLGILAMLVAVWVVNHKDYRRVKYQSDSQGRELRFRFSHNAIVKVGSWLWLAMLVAAPIWVLFVFLFWYAIDIHTGPSTLVMSDVVQVIAQVSAVGVVLFVVLGGRPASVRRILATIADIAGFWNTRFHPLAGDSYRDSVLGGLRKETASQDGRRIVLVGHSQGSVIAAWFVATDEHPDLALVTCGSPLRSLYGTFFPRYFDDKFFRAVSTRSRGWVNTWRATDPIATPVVGPNEEEARDEELSDPPDGSRQQGVRGHSDYWTDDQQTRIVRDLGRRPSVSWAVSRLRLRPSRATDPRA